MDASELLERSLAGNSLFAVRSIEVKVARVNCVIFGVRREVRGKEGKLRSDLRRQLRKSSDTHDGSRQARSVHSRNHHISKSTSTRDLPSIP